MYGFPRGEQKEGEILWQFISGIEAPCAKSYEVHHTNDFQQDVHYHHKEAISKMYSRIVTYKRMKLEPSSHCAEKLTQSGL